MSEKDSALDWVVVGAKRKRIEVVTVPIHNQFDPIDVDDDDRADEVNNCNNTAIGSIDDTENNEQFRPPPLVVSGVQNYDKMINALISITGEGQISCSAQTDGDIRIAPKTIQAFKALESFFESKKLDFHTYQIKNERTFDVVLHNLHRSYDQDALKEILQARGHRVKSMSVMKRNVFDYHLQQKVLVDMDKFLIHLYPAQNNVSIYDIRTIDHSVVKFEPRIKKKDPVGPQCTRCWKRGHSKNFCRRPVVCGICAQEHWTKDCKQAKTTTPTCINCNQNHTANYKGCIDYQAKLKRKERMFNHRQQQEVQQQQPFVYRESEFAKLPGQQNINYKQPINHNLPYSHVTSQNNNTITSQLELLIKKQMEQTDRLMTMMASIIQLLQNQCPK